LGAAATVLMTRRAVRRGLGVRIICPTAFARREITQRFATVDGAAVRTVVDPPIELHVFDRRVAVIVTAGPHKTDAFSFLVRGQPLTQVLHSVFETWWIHAQETCAVTDEQSTGLPGEDQALLQLLAKSERRECRPATGVLGAHGAAQGIGTARQTRFRQQIPGRRPGGAPPVGLTIS
jgi:hypothetical protein